MTGPYRLAFGGECIGLVDAAFGPVFRYFDVFEKIGDFGFFDGRPNVTGWRTRLASRPSVREGVGTEYPDRLRAFLMGRRSALSRHMSPATRRWLQPQAPLAGRSNMKQVPFAGWLSTRRTPPCSLTTRLAIAWPRPAPAASPCRASALR
jgi:hypothetical protein